jgi:hypothetical protein
VSPYRSNEHVLAAGRLELAELAAFTKEARLRRRRAAAGLAVILSTGVLVLFAVRGRYPGPVLHCHKVVLKYEQASGLPPPPAEWTACEMR